MGKQEFVQEGKCMRLAQTTLPLVLALYICIGNLNCPTRFINWIFSVYVSHSHFDHINVLTQFISHVSIVQRHLWMFLKMQSTVMAKGWRCLSSTANQNTPSPPFSWGIDCLEILFWFWFWIMYGSVRSTMFVSHSQRQNCVLWTPRFLSAHTKQTAVEKYEQFAKYDRKCIELESRTVAYL